MSHKPGRNGGTAAGAPTRAPVSRPVLRPQAHWQQTVLEAARIAVPTGLGLDSQVVRERMVQRLRMAGIGSEAVWACMQVVPRHAFVDSALAPQAYEDTSLPIGHDQTISKPSVVARMLSLLLQGPTAQMSGSLGRVLEIGTGCGYQAALLAGLARSVVSVERIGALHQRAARNLALAQVQPVRLVHADGMHGHAARAPYDSIISAASGEALPEAWLQQLAVGARLIAPVWSADSRTQALQVVDRTASGLVSRVLEAVHFVPLKSGAV